MVFSLCSVGSNKRLSEIDLVWTLRLNRWIIGCRIDTMSGEFVTVDC